MSRGAAPFRVVLALLLLTAARLSAAATLQIPFQFELNRGQAAATVRYIARGDGYRILLGERGNRILLPEMSVDFRFVRSDALAPIHGEQQLAGRVNYLRRGTQGSLTDIPTFERVRQSGIYPGIDVVYYGNAARLEYDLEVAPGADPQTIGIRFDNIEKLTVDEQGNLHIHAAGREIIQHEPLVYQATQPVSGKYRLIDKQTVGFDLGPYDRHQLLVIDPVLTYSTFLGGTDGDQNGRAVTTDAAGNIYVAGSTTSTNFPTHSPLQVNAGTSDSTLGFSDAFLLKLNPSGSTLIYSTYLGGSDDDEAVGIAVDGSGNVIIAGTTTSTDFPTTGNAFRSQCTLASDGTCSDTFVAKLNPTGSALVFATYLGGSDDDETRGVAVDAQGNIVVAGATASLNFPLAGTPYSTTPSSGAFISKFSPAGTLLASTYFGAGIGTTDLRGLAVDPGGNVYVTGATPSTPATASDVFVSKLNAALSAVVYSSFIRGSNDEAGNSIAVDATGNAYVTGQTSSRNFSITPGAVQTSLSGGPVFKTTNNGSNWSAAGNGIARTSIDALALAPSNPPTLYAGADDGISGGVFRSIDSGNTWIEADSGLNLDARVHALSVDPKTPTTVYAGTASAGMYKTVNSGSSWAATGLTGVFVSTIAIDPSNPSTIYAGSNGSGIYKSADGGSTWSAVNNGITSLDIQALAIDPSTPLILYAGTPSGLFKTLDGGNTWNSSGAGLLDPNVNALLVDPRNPKMLYAATSSVGIFRSLNGGSGWLAANSGIPSSSSGILATAIALNPNTGTFFAAAGESNALTIYTSTNGIIWTSTGLATTAVTGLAVDPSNGQNAYVATVGSTDAFVAKWDASGNLLYSTYLGGYRDDSGNGIAVDATGDAYITGTTSSVNFPLANALQPSFGGGSDITTDAFAAKLGPALTSILYSTYLGGTANDFGNAIAVDNSGNAYVVGQTGSTNFPAASPLMAATGTLDAFVAKISEVTAVPYSVMARGGYTAATQGSGSSISVGYGRVTANAGATTPQGEAIFGFRSNNVLISEAAVPASPAILTGRFYAEVGGAIDTGVAIANPNSQAVTISFYVTNNNGSVTPGSTTIPANNQIAAFLDQAPFSAGTGIKGTFTFTASAPVAVVALRGHTNERGEFLITTLPVVDLSTTATAGPVVFPHFADGGGWTTQVVLVNPSDSSLSGSIQFVAQSGQNIGSASSYTIAARGSFTLQTSGTAATVQVGSILVTPSAGTNAPSGVAVFSLRNNGITVTESGVPAIASSGTAFRLYAESSGFFGNATIGSIQTGVAVVNLSSNAATVNFDLTTLNGTSASPTGSISLAANGQAAMFLNQIPGLATLPNPFEGVLRVSSSAPIAVIGLRGRYNERSDFLITTTPPTNESTPAPSGDLFFPHFADGGGYTTQFILFNGSADQSSSGVIRFFTQSGQVLSLSLR